MITGVEFDFIVKDSLQALALYESIFEVERIEVTNLALGQNEAVFTIFGVRFHILDENTEFEMYAPSNDMQMSFWFNVIVPDIKDTYAKAMKAGCKEVQAVTEMSDYGVSNAFYKDPFGYLWMLHEVHKEVSFEDRVKMAEES